MKRQVVHLIVSMCLVLVGCNRPQQTVITAPGEPKPTDEALAAGDYRISGPYAHENLAVFLIHGEDRLAGKEFLTLGEALEQKKVVVHETEVVEELAIENVGDTDVFIQAGDIVRGGKQDRVIPIDLVLESQSGRMPLASLCVEQGRWTQRGAESSTAFLYNSNSVPLKELKLAFNADNSQTVVWEEVRNLQSALSTNISGEVREEASASSLELTMEHDNVKDATEKYMTALQTLPESKDDVIGYAFALNGKLNSADVYASRALFKKLWKKLLKANAVEAVARKGTDATAGPLSADMVKTWLVESEKEGDTTAQEVSPRIRMLRRESKANLLSETRDASMADEWLHRSYIRK